MRPLLARVLREAPPWLLIAGLLAVTFYLVNAFHFGAAPLRIEEREWPPMAKAIFETGKPVITGEAHRVAFTEAVTIDHPVLIGAWHPPLYLYTLGASMSILGADSLESLRAVGAIGLLLSAILLLLIAREVASRWQLIGGVAAILLLIHPYAIQGSVFLDIDNSIYAPIALLTVWLAIRYGKSGEPLAGRQILSLGGALALLTWTKMTTTIVVVAVLALWWLLSRGSARRAAAEIALVAGVGAGLFFATYAVWCALTDIPFSYTFDVTFAQKSNRLFSEWTVVEHAIHWHLRWLGATLVLLAVVYAVDLVRRFSTESRLHPLDLPFLIGLGVLCQYILISPTDGTYQGKYAFPALCAMLLPIVWLLLRNVSRPPTSAWIVAIGVGLVAALLTPDVLANLSFAGNYGSWAGEIEVLMVAGAALLLTWILNGRPSRFAGGAVIVFAALSLSQALHSYRADTSPMYPIEDRGDFEAAVKDLNASTNPGDIVVAPKDLGLYVQRQVVEGEDAFARGDERLADAIVRYPEITAFARDSFGPPIGPATQATLERCFQEVRAHGTATVFYRSKSCE